MTSVWFLVPCYGRLALTEVCLRQLARTCDELAERGFQATAAIGADDESLDIAQALGFATYETDNRALGRKWNDLYELSCRYGEADFVIPLGSDDWIAPDFLSGPLPADNEIRCTRRSSVVNEDATKLACLRIRYARPFDFGDGVRIIPRKLLEPLRFRPAEEHVNRAIDTSVIRRLRPWSPRFVYHDCDPLHLVDWKSKHDQLNSYERCLVFKDGPEVEPFEALAPHYPEEALDEMRALHGLVMA